LKKLALLALGIGLISASTFAESAAKFQRTEDVIYGRKFGTALTLDVFQPAKPNGAAVAWMVSGGWFSSHDSIRTDFIQQFLNHGYTVFTVVHGSQPKFIGTEIVQDIHRSIRFIRHNAARYGIDANKIGIAGGSAGGHLTLTMATQGQKGDPSAKDPIDRESSEVECAACFFPPTDFLNYGSPGDDAVGVGTLKAFKAAFGPEADTAEGRKKLGRELSPIYFVHSNLPPILIIHGDADKLVPIYQSQMFVKRCEAAGCVARLVTKPGKQHGWPDFQPDVESMADWFDTYLLKKAKETH
jgi:acetyl esterase/lipase